MPVDEKTREALDLKSLNLPPEIPITRIEVEDYTSWDGDPSLRVTVILDEAVEVEKVSGDVIGELKNRSHNSLIDHGVARYPYFFLAKQSELDAQDDEELSLHEELLLQAKFLANQ